MKKNRLILTALVFCSVLFSSCSGLLNSVAGIGPEGFVKAGSGVVLTCTTSTSSHVTKLSWPVVPGAKYYTVYYNTKKNDFDTAKVLKEKVKDNSYEYNFFKDNSDATFIWVTYNNGKESEPSNFGVANTQFGDQDDRTTGSYTYNYLNSRNYNASPMYLKREADVPYYVYFSVKAGKKYIVEWYDVTNKKNNLVDKGYNAFANLKATCYMTGGANNSDYVVFNNLKSSADVSKVTFYAPCNSYYEIRFDNKDTSNVVGYFGVYIREL